jgi:hypothetical protein
MVRQTPPAGVRGIRARALPATQSPNIGPLAGASRPASIRGTAALADLAGQGLEDLRLSAQADFIRYHK